MTTFIWTLFCIMTPIKHLQLGQFPGQLTPDKQLRAEPSFCHWTLELDLLSLAAIISTGRQRSHFSKSAQKTTTTFLIHFPPSPLLLYLFPFASNLSFISQLLLQLAGQIYTFATKSQLVIVAAMMIIKRMVAAMLRCCNTSSSSSSIPQSIKFTLLVFL